jgi:AcrR family transcriptional regulator
MAGVREQKRIDLKTRLIEATEARIVRDGLKALRARDITNDAKCALGALYQAFTDLDELVLHVKARALRTLGSMVEAGIENVRGPEAMLHFLAANYLAFARSHTNLWRALFDPSFNSNAPIPDWYKEEQAVLIRYIIAPLVELQPALAKDLLRQRAQTFFAAVHGIVTISLEGRYVGLTAQELDDELSRFVNVLIDGTRGTRDSQTPTSAPAIRQM